MIRVKRGLVLRGASGFGFCPVLLQPNVVVRMRESKWNHQMFLRVLLNDGVVAKMNATEHRWNDTERGTAKMLAENPVPVTGCRSQTSQRLDWDGTGGSVAKNRLLRQPRHGL